MGGFNGVRMGDWVPEIDAPVDTTAQTYASGDVLFNAGEATRLIGASMSNGTSVLQSIILIDYDTQGVAIDLIFLRSLVSIGAVAAAINISPATALEIVGIVAVPAANYDTLGTILVATVENIGIVMHPRNGTSLWLAAAVRGAPTYPSGHLGIKAGFLRG